MSQKSRILIALRNGPVCGTTLLEWHIPRYAARIHELRAEGYHITTETCRLHVHYSPQTVYRLADGQLF